MKNAVNCVLLTLFEAVLIKICVYIAIAKNCAIFDTVSFASYKYFGLCFILIVMILGKTDLFINLGISDIVSYIGWAVKVYYCIASAFLMFKSIQKLGDDDNGAYNERTLANGDKLRAFALGLAAAQILFSWLLIKLSL